MKTNGQDKNSLGPNGHSTASLPREVCVTHPEKGEAASDDERDLPHAAAASAAAGTERVACAEAALPRGRDPKNRRGHLRGKYHHAKSNARRNAEKPDPPKLDTRDTQVEIPPGVEPLAADGPRFVDAMHAHVDLYLAVARLVKSRDEKIAERIVERLLEMSYGKSPSAANEESQELGVDTDSAAGRRPREGAKE